jgi:hypothetical protein
MNLWEGEGTWYRGTKSLACPAFLRPFTLLLFFAVCDYDDDDDDDDDDSVRSLLATQ